MREATIDATAALVARGGLMSVSMSQVAEATGIGRATLYRYFPDVESILLAWHERQVAVHLEQLRALRARAADPASALERVLEAYAFMSHERHGTQLAAALHRADHVDRAHQELQRFIAELLAEAATTGEFRSDVSPSELAFYCLHALSGAGSAPSKAAVRRLVAITLDGLRAQAGRAVA